MKNTSNVQTEVLVEQTTKKEWITPEMTELNLNKPYSNGESALAGLSGV